MKKSVTKFTLDFRMPNRPFKLAELKKNKNEDLETPWYVEYHIFSLDENKLVRRRKVLRQNTVEKRIKIGELIISGINKKLLSGAILKNGEEYKEPVEKDTQKEQIQPETEAAPVADPDDITAEAAIIQFIAQKKRTVRKSTMESYNTHVKSKFFKFCEKRGILKEPIKNFTSTMAHEYLDELSMNPEYSNRVVNNSRGAVTTLFSFIIDRAKKKWINPFKSTKKLAALKQKHTAFTDNQVGEMIEVMQNEEYRHLYLFVSFMFYCFLRPHEEVRNIQVKDIDIKKRSLILKAAAAKNGKKEHVRIPDAFLEIIKESKVLDNPDHYYLFSNKNCPGLKPASKHFICRRHSQVLEKCGLTGQNIDLYSWKHTGVCAMFRATQNVEVIREQARFADMNTCMHYLRDLGLFIDYSEVNKMPRLKDFKKKSVEDLQIKDN